MNSEFDIDAALTALARRNEELESRARTQVALAEETLKRQRAQLDATSDPLAALNMDWEAVERGSPAASLARPATSNSAARSPGVGARPASGAAARPATAGRGAAGVSRGPVSTNSPNPSPRPASRIPTATGGSRATAAAATAAASPPIRPAPASRPSTASRAPPSPSLLDTSSAREAEVDASTAGEAEVPGAPDATIRLQRVKIKTLERDLETITRALQDRTRETESVEREVRQLRADKAQWDKAKVKYDAQTERARRELDDLRTQLEAKERALQEVGRTGDRIVQERAKQEQEARQRDVRLNRALEEVERYKRLFEDMRHQDKDGREVTRAEHNRVLMENKKLAQQKQELLVTLRKQMRLIDVLKRQKIHIEAARMLALTEEEFVRVLDLAK